jgi:hypothetical protein
MDHTNEIGRMNEDENGLFVNSLSPEVQAATDEREYRKNAEGIAALFAASPEEKKDGRHNPCNDRS